MKYRLIQGHRKIAALLCLLALLACTSHVAALPEFLRATISPMGGNGLQLRMAPFFVITPEVE